MKILAIETSCDETAVAVLQVEGGENNPQFEVLGNALYSQAHKHEEYGGVYPTLAKREHAQNLAPLLMQALKEAKLLHESNRPNPPAHKDNLFKILEREPALLVQLIPLLSQYKKPDIDYIAVTQGPGLEPALWVGINCAKTLSLVWDIPLLPTNHMKGHTVSVLYNLAKDSQKISFPAIALLISGGHTELDIVHDWHSYECIGATRDDAVGEAFDKVARLLDLSYPGGPEISKLAEEARRKKDSHDEGFISLPRPMIDTSDYDFSFSGLKTAVRYFVDKHKPLSKAQKQAIAYEFEEAVIDVLLHKTARAIQEKNIQTLIVAGGVANNTHIRETFAQYAKDNGVALLVPEQSVTTDNAVMIGIASYFSYIQDPHIQEKRGMKYLSSIGARANESLAGTTVATPQQPHHQE